MLKYIIGALIWLGASMASAQYAPENDTALAAAQAGDWQTAWDIWKPLADAGDARAQSNIGVMYDNGKLVEQDSAEAVHWYTLSAENGFAPGQFNLAVSYFQGQGIEQDLAAAAHWGLLAARQGNPYAQMFTSKMYYDGTGVPQNLALGYMWMWIAAQSGLQDAVNGLPYYENNVGKATIVEGRAMAEACMADGLETCP